MLQITLDKPGRFSRSDAPEPTRSEGEALVRARRIGVCGTDLHAFAGRQPFFEYPRVLGHELGVEIIEVDSNGLGLEAGDRCAVEPYLNCENCVACRAGKSNCCESLRVLGVHVDGGMRPLIAVPMNKLHKSETLSFDQLALVETLGIGAHAVERAKPTSGERALVVGAGPIGLGVIQFLQVAGADVTVMDLSKERLAFCREQLGVTKTISDATQLPKELPTLIIDATGHRGSMEGDFDLVAPGGRIVFVGLVMGALSFDDPNFHKREVTLMASRNALPETMRRIIALIEAGRIDTTPWITHRLKLADVVDDFAKLPGSGGLIKAMIEVEE